MCQRRHQGSAAGDGAAMLMATRVACVWIGAWPQMQCRRQAAFLPWGGHGSVALVAGRAAGEHSAQRHVAACDAPRVGTRQCSVLAHSPPRSHLLSCKGLVVCLAARMHCLCLDTCEGIPRYTHAFFLVMLSPAHALLHVHVAVSCMLSSCRVAQILCSFLQARVLYGMISSIFFVCGQRVERYAVKV